MSELPNAERNALLRRADWRYLLPDPAPRRALCLAGGQLRESCGVVASRVDVAPHPGIAYDLVVAENPDEPTLRAMAAVLGPNGVCYTEWTRAGLHRPRRVRRAVAGAGFRAPRAYHPWPSDQRCSAWVPTEGLAAAHHWRGAARSTRVRAEKVRANADAVLARLGLQRRIGVVGLGALASAEPALVRIAREHGALPATFGDGNTTGEWLMLTLGERVVGKVVMLTFDATGAAAVAIKTARTPESASGIEREAHVLEAVHAVHSNRVRGAPVVLFRTEASGAPVVGQSALAGVPLAAGLWPRSYPRIAERVTDWLCALAAPGTRVPPEPAWDRVIAPAFERFAAEFGGVVGVERLARTRAALLTLGTLPVVCEQRDFSPWNVFDGANGLVVLDWESGEPRGLPALDLLYFFTHAAFYLESAWTSGRFEAAYRAAWSPGSAIGRVNHASVARYFELAGLGLELLPPLRLFAWVLHAHSDYVHLCADAGGRPGADLLRHSRFLRLFDVELDEGTQC